MYKQLDPEDAPVGICDDCGCACTGELQDNGIGSYEFWGEKGTHHEWVFCSPCCGAEVVEGDQKLKSRTIHVARRNHADGKVKKGDKYERLVFHHWRENGPGWYTVQKIVLIKAAA